MVLAGNLFLALLATAFVTFVALALHTLLPPSESIWTFFAAATGGVAGGGAVIASIYLNRRHRREALMKSLYAEFYNRASRCCLDFDTWIRIVDQNENVSLSRFRKFRPFEPTIYMTIAEGAGIIPGELTASLIAFYGFLDGVRRDIDKEPDTIEQRFATGERRLFLTDAEKCLFASRMTATLRPALKAVEEFRRYPKIKAMTETLHEANRVYLADTELLPYLKRHVDNILDMPGFFAIANPSITASLPP